ncbi:hypothetical protein AVEN_143230-1 [Araneus ventricosus]|uniref:Uncharacterized protein n=1 Tax=Araneus ventricosus TaxID=182803 RepID=A0A4Y2AG17_ARAVE|nr:hypothetical protein AVEN_143230-1 [Araneus ventricosus]
MVQIAKREAASTNTKEGCTTTSNRAADKKREKKSQTFSYRSIEGRLRLYGPEVWQQNGYRAQYTRKNTTDGPKRSLMYMDSYPFTLSPQLGRPTEGPLAPSHFRRTRRRG